MKPRHKFQLHLTRSRGFALVVTLSLMILLTISAVGLLSLSSISLRASSQGAAMAHARANARLALMLAIGDLQKNTGPDQRVTARAEILDSRPDTPAVDDVKQPYWTASWITGDLGLDSPNSGASQRQTSFNASTPSIADKVKSGKWLVSNPNPNPSAATPLDPTTYNGTSTGPNPNAVIVAKGLGAAAADVAVPLVNIVGSAATQPSGRYGYWVSDEGVKAKVNLVDPTIGFAANTQTGQAHFLAPQANAIHKIVGLASAGKDFRTDNGAVALAQTITTDTIKLLPTSPAGLSIKPFLTDVTTDSCGVIADVKNGGLKKDLTAAFETQGGFTALSTNFGYGKNCAYRNHPKLTVPFSTLMIARNASSYEGITDGLPWAAFYAYYNIYKDVMVKPSGTNFDSTAAAPTSAGSITSLPYVMSTRVATYKANLSEGRGKYGGIVPEIIAQRTDISLQSYLSNGKWKLRLRYCPQLVLHNPYHCTILAPNFRMTRNYFIGWSSTTGTTGGKSAITVKVGGVQIATKTVIQQAPSSSANRYQQSTKVGQCNSLAPGETRVFGLSQDVAKSDPGAAITFTDLTSEPNLSPDFAQYCDLPIFTTVTTVNYSDSFVNGPAWEGTEDPNALVELPASLNHSFNKIEAGAADTSISPNNQWPSAISGRIFSTLGPRLTTDPQPWAAIPISSLTTPRIIGGFFIRKKGIVPSSSSLTYENGAQVIPLFHGNAPFFTPFDNVRGVAWREFYMNPFGRPYTSASEVEMFKSPAGYWETYCGGASVGVSVNAAPIRTVLRDVPNQPLISIGQFMHMPTMVFSWDNPAMTDYFNFGHRDTGSMFIGGSMANPFIPTNVNLREDAISNSHKNLFFDDSYLANDALFDRFFFSTVPPSSLNGNAPQQWRDFNTANPDTRLKSTTPLPNSRIKPYDWQGTPPLMSDLRDFNKAAANLMLDGAFNVNSTSVNAWKALLSSLSGNDMAVNSLSGGSGTISSSILKNPIPRFWSASIAGNVNQAWEGTRALSDDEVTELAQRIVEQVKLRGPFLSMADFLNRRLGNPGDLTRIGCLQMAIDKTSPDINQQVKAAGRTVNASGSGTQLNDGTNGRIPDVIPGNMLDGAGNALNSALGMPGYLMQQDLVQAFSPAMTVRSDTFKIRAYGESVNSAGVVQAKAWAEAVVQRVPEFVDAAADPLPETYPLANLTSPINQSMGRRFKLVSFRWLSPDEI
jgi:hypothetical protein